MGGSGAALAPTPAAPLARGPLLLAVLPVPGLCLVVGQLLTPQLLGVQANRRFHGGACVRVAPAQVHGGALPVALPAQLVAGQVDLGEQDVAHALRLDGVQVLERPVERAEGGVQVALLGERATFPVMPGCLVEEFTHRLSITAPRPGPGGNSRAGRRRGRPPRRRPRSATRRGDPGGWQRWCRAARAPPAGPAPRDRRGA